MIRWGERTALHDMMRQDEKSRKWSREEADEQIRRMAEMSIGELEELWAEVFGGICYSRRRSYVRRRLEWRINTLVSGGISERARKRAEEIMDDTLLRLKVRAYRPREEQAVRLRQMIRKVYKGEVHEVYCYEYGAEYRGKVYRSLSAVATYIAGYHVSCTKFFGVYARKKQG